MSPSLLTRWVPYLEIKIKYFTFSQIVYFQQIQSWKPQIYRLSTNRIYVDASVTAIEPKTHVHIHILTWSRRCEYEEICDYLWHYTAPDGCSFDFEVPRVSYSFSFALTVFILNAISTKNHLFSRVSHWVYTPVAVAASATLYCALRVLELVPKFLNELTEWV